MNDVVKMAGYVGALAVVFGLTVGVGDAVGPAAEPPPEHTMSEEPDAGHGHRDQDAHADDAGSEHGGASTADDIPGGLMVSQDGYTLRLARETYRPGTDVPVDFTVTGPAGDPVTGYEQTHEKELHLIAVRRDMAGYQHVHPRLDPATGTWTTALDLEPGQWRLFADFAPTGAEPLTLGADLSVPGHFDPADTPTADRTDRVGPYTVALDGDLAAGEDAKLTLTVSKDGEPVTDLQPYLGAYGHLVALRTGDLAYLHVHPDGEPGDGSTTPGPRVSFYAGVPSDGDYRLFFDFKHGGRVHTASFPVSTGHHS